MPEVKKIVKLRKSGNSLIVTIPKDIADLLKWKEEDYVLVEIQEVKESHFGGKRIVHIERVEAG
jgi:antitoxin component of MazEF toxin-antitoxin module